MTSAAAWPPGGAAPDGGTTPSARPRAATPERGAQQEDLDDDGLVNWMTRLEAKLDALLELSSQSAAPHRRDVEKSTAASRSRELARTAASRSGELAKTAASRSSELAQPRRARSRKQAPHWRRELLRRGSSAASVPSLPKRPLPEEEEEFKVVISKTTGQTLGLSFADGPTLEILAVSSDGLVQQWNEGHPELAVKRGHFVVEVNGIRNDTLKMFNECRQAKTLELVVKRSQTGRDTANGPGLPGVGRRSVMSTIQSVESVAPADWRMSSPQKSKRLSHTSTAKRKCGPLGTIVASPQFDALVTLVILLNACLIGAQVQHNATSDSRAEWFDHAEYACTFLFTVELVVRIVTQTPQIFVLDPHERFWNLTDALFVLVSWFDIVLISFLDSGLPESSTFFGKLCRVIRVVRIMRIIRTVRFLAQLRVMIKMIVNSFKSLTWILIILFGIIYSFAIVLTAGATDYLKMAGEITADHTDVEFYFGSLFDTMYTLFMCITGGLNWGETAFLMRGPGWVLEAVVVVYIFFAIFAVANIVNGVFVDGAIELAKHDRLTILAKQQADDAANEKHLVNLRRAIDKDDNGKVTFEEFCSALERDDVREYIAALQLDITDVQGFFALLDENASGSVSIAEFFAGMSKMRGEARSVDVHIMLHETRALIKMVCGLVDYVHEKVGDGEFLCQQDSHELPMCKQDSL